MRAVIPLLRRHSLALLVTTLAFIFTLILWPFGQRFPFALFIAAVLASAWQGGPRSALITTILSAGLLFSLYFLLSAEQLAELGSDYVMRLGLFTFVGLVASFLCYQYHRANRAITDAGAILTNASVALILAGRRGQVRTLNTQAQALTGWPPEEATGRPIQQVLHLRTGTGDPLAIPVGVLDDGKPRSLPADALVVALDGKQMPIEGTVTASEGSGDGLRSLIVSFRDVSDLKQAGAKARARESHLLGQLAELGRAREAWSAERDQLRQALAAEQQLKREFQVEGQALRLDLEKAEQAQASSQLQAEEKLKELRAGYDGRLDEQGQKLVQVEAALRQVQLDHGGRLAAMAAEHEQQKATLRQTHEQLSQELSDTADGRAHAQEALQSTQAELAALREQHQALEIQAAGAAEQVRAEAESAARQVHSDWEKRLAEQLDTHEHLHAALKRELADHQELLKELEQEEQTLRQERDFFLGLLLCSLPAFAQPTRPLPNGATVAPEPALAAGRNGGGAEPPAGSDERTDLHDWLSFN
jgi:PAS domain S-box-containing protein